MPEPVRPRSQITGRDFGRGEGPERRQRRGAEQRPHDARLVEPAQLVDDMTLDLEELFRGQAAQAQPLGVLAPAQVDLGDVQGRVVVVIAVGVDEAVGDQEPRAVRRPAGGGRHPPDRGIAQRDDRPPQHVGPRLEVGARQGRAVDDGAEPAVAGELGGGHLERPLPAAATDHHPQPGLLGDPRRSTTTCSRIRMSKLPIWAGGVVA